MNRVIMNIEILRHISNSKYKVISIDLNTQFDEPRDYEYWSYISKSKYKVTSILRAYVYWNYKIYFKFKI